MSRYIDADALWMDVIHAMDYADDFLQMIEETPTADVRENEYGEWIIQDGKIVCSNCFEPNFETNYCPYCGADMRGGKS